MIKSYKNIGLLILLAIISGSSYFLMKRGLFTLSGNPIFTFQQVASLRIAIAGLLLLPFGLKYLKRIKTKQDFIYLTLVGLTGNFIPSFLFTFAETKITSNLAGMLNSITPIFTLLIGMFFFNVKITFYQLIGLLIATSGIILLVLGKNDLKITEDSISWLPIFSILLATCLYGISLNLTKYKLQQFKSYEITALSFSILFFPALFSVFNLETVHTLKTNPNAFEGIIFILLLAVFCTAIAVLIYNQIIATSTTIFASSVTYFTPLVAIFIGVYFKESVTTVQILAILIILLGVFISNYYQKKDKNRKHT